VITAADAAAANFAIAARLTNRLKQSAGSGSSGLRVSVSLRPDDANSSGMGSIGCLENILLKSMPWESQLLSCSPAVPLTAGFYALDATLTSTDDDGSTLTAEYEGGLVVLAHNLSSGAPALGVFGTQVRTGTVD